jgi:thiol:disulfide interchange protein
MKHFLVLLLGFLISFPVTSQPTSGQAEPEPVKLTVSSIEKNGVWELNFNATIEKGWSVYSQNNYGDMGPWPTSIVLDPVAGLTVHGKADETGEKILDGMDEVFGMVVKKFKGSATFTQKLSVLDPSQTVTGAFEYMTCNDQMCLPPTTVFFRVVLATDRSELSGLPFKGKPMEADGPPVEEEPVTWSLATEKLEEGRWRLLFTAAIQEHWAIYSMKEFGEGPIPTSFVLDSLAPAKFIGQAKEESADMLEGMDDMFGILVRKFKNKVTFIQELEVTDASKDIKGVVNYQTCNDSKCIFPDPVPFSVNFSTGLVSIGSRTVAAGSECKYKLSTVDLNDPVVSVSNEVNEVRDNASLWRIFFLGFLGGLVALLTPCVFPMIPLTVSFFTKGSEDKGKGLRNALTYGGFILGIYLLFSLPFHVLGSVNAEIFNEISTSPWLNIFFFVIFLVFAVSFFGYFEITLPSSWVNSMDAKASRFGGLIGIFFMALTLALVSFSCTGPILGSLLAGALTADGGAWQLTAGLGGFGLALALPFALFALFPSWLNSLPRSGSWLNSVKVVLGFAEIALAFKFLSNADLVKQWSIVPYELFMVVWVLCSLGIVLYLFGLIRFPHDSPVKSRSVMRWGFIGLFTAATIYLSFGLRVDKEEQTFTPMALMSGLAPPVGYSWILPKKAEAFHDLEEAMAYAKKVNKPVMVDFTGWACVNCRKMEEHVWPKEGVKELIENDYVLVSLYVDDKRELPKEEQHEYVTCTGKEKLIVTNGNKWSTVQLETFVISSQPYYALLSPDGKLLTDPVGYTPDKNEYAGFLQRGLDAMKKLSLQASR